jgi:predicted dehydrogenase
LNKKIKIAVLGYGYLGKWHCQKVKHFSNEAELIAIVEKKAIPEDVKKLLAAEYPNTIIVNDISEVINKIDAAIVVTPTSSHYELVDYLLKNRKHVFCEKPLTSTLQESLKLKERVESSGSTLQVGHSERFHEVWDLLKDYADFFKYPSIVKINRVAPFKGRATDVDVVQDLMIHDIDLIMFLFKEIPKLVKSTGFKIRTDKWDYVHSEFSLGQGHNIHITSSRNSTKESRTFEMINEKGSMLVDLFNGRFFISTKNEGLEQDFVKNIEFKKRDHLLLEHEYFYNSIKNKNAPIVNIDDGLNAVALVSDVLNNLVKPNERQSLENNSYGI